MKRLLNLVSSVLLIVNSLYAEVTKRELLDYFYPNEVVYSTMTGDNYLGLKEYYLTPNKLIVTHVINYLGYDISYKHSYTYIFEHNKIVSNSQLIGDAFGGGYEWHYDRKVLFVIPTDDKPYKWEEIKPGEGKHNLEAINVYIEYRGDYYKAIKITDSYNFTSNDKKEHSDVEWSYWIKDKGKVARYGSLDGGERILLEVIGNAQYSNIYNDIVNEVTKDEYDDYFLKLEMKRSYEKFKSSLQPVSISEYSSVYNKIEDKAFELISADTTSLLACKNIGQGYIDIKVYKDNDVNIYPYIPEKNGLKLGAVTDSLKKYVEHLVETDEIKIDSIKEEYTGEIGYIPQEMHLSIEYSKKAYMFSVAYKKGEWVIMKDSQEIPDFLKEKVEETANKFLLQNQKAKKQRIYITYIKLNNYLLFPQAEAVLYKK